MEVITIETNAFKEIVKKLNNIEQYVKENTKPSYNGWIENSDVCRNLKVSTRTLQRLRSDKKLNYSIVRGKTYYRISEIERMMEENLIKATPKDFQNLLDEYFKSDRNDK